MQRQLECSTGVFHHLIFSSPRTVSCPRLHQIILVLVLVLWLCSMFCVVLWTGFSINITVIVSTPLVVGVFQIIVYWVRTFLCVKSCSYTKMLSRETATNTILSLTSFIIANIFHFRLIFGTQLGLRYCYNSSLTTFI